jgi:enterochelin esterase-like enzyme
VLTRRTFLNASAVLALAGEAAGQAAAPQIATSGALTWAELPLERWRGEKYRALVIFPAQRQAPRAYPGLLLFHGRGESGSAELGLHAWRTRYGLESSHARLSRAPLALGEEQRAYIEPAQLRALELALGETPFSGCVYICPFTPNPHRQRSPEALLDGYADWIEHSVLPAAREHAPLAATTLGVDGCSMGGFVAAEIFVRKPHLFQTFGVVQPAFGVHRVARYAEHLARALGSGSLRGAHLETSSLDPYRGAVEALDRALRRRGARGVVDVLPGPHDQRWLRATGTLVMLAWHERLLRAGSGAGSGPGTACTGAEPAP